MILFFRESAALSSSAHPSCRMCSAVLFHRGHRPGDLSRLPPRSGAGVSAMWAHLQASVESDLGAAPLQP